MKGISKEEVDGRNDLVLSLRDKIEAIPEGSAPVSGWAASTSYSNIRFDTNVPGNINCLLRSLCLISDSGLINDDLLLCCSIVSGHRIDSEYFKPTEESHQFKQEYEMRRVKQASFFFLSFGLMIDL